MLEAVVIGDIHLDKLETLFPLKHLTLQINEIKKPLDYALVNGIEHVFMLGDIGHKPRLSESAKIAFLDLLHAYDGKLEIHIILGNHDIHSEGTNSLSIFTRMQELGKFQSVYIYPEPKQKILNGVTVNFLPFPKNKALPSTTMSVNLAHIDRGGAKRDNGYRIKEDENEEALSDIWVIGHLHTPQTLGSNVYFPGTLYQLSFGEGLLKGFAHLKCKMVGSKLRHKYIWIENKPAFTLNTLKVEKVSDFAQIDDNMLHLYKVYVRTGVKVPRELPANVNNIVGYDTDRELSALTEFNMEDQSDGVTFGLTTGLDEYLTSKGATDYQIRRANAWLSKILEKDHEKSKTG